MLPRHIVQVANTPAPTCALLSVLVMVYTAPSTDPDMGASRALNYAQPQNTTVKVEPVSFDAAQRLLRSPLPSSTRSSPVRHSAPLPRCKRKSSYSSTRGVLSVMTHPYGSWSSPGLKSDQSAGQRGFSGAMHTGPTRRTGSGEYGFADYPQQVRLSSAMTASCTDLFTARTVPQ